MSFLTQIENSLVIIAKEVYDLKQMPIGGGSGESSNIGFIKLNVDLSSVRAIHESLRSGVNSVTVKFPESVKGNMFLYLQNRAVTVLSAREIQLSLSDNYEDRVLYVMPIVHSAVTSITLPKEDIDTSGVRSRIKQVFVNLANTKLREINANSSIQLNEETLMFYPNFYFTTTGKEMTEMAQINDEIMGKIQFKYAEVLQAFDAGTLDSLEDFTNIDNVPDKPTNMLLNSKDFSDFNNNNSGLYTLTKGEDTKGKYLLGSHNRAPYISTYSSLFTNTNLFRENLANTRIKVSIWLRTDTGFNPQVKLENGEYVTVGENWTEATTEGVFSRMVGIYMDKEAPVEEGQEEKLNNCKLYYGLVRVTKID